MQLRAHPGAPPSDDAQARSAYFELLASDEPLAGPPGTTDAGAYLQLLASSGPLADDHTSTTEAAAAYLELLASDKPLAGPPSTADAATAYLKLLASDGPLAGPPSTTDAAAAYGPLSSRQSHAHGHRAPATTPIASALLSKHSQRALMAALVTTLGVAGVSSATAVKANHVQAAPRSHAQPLAPTPSATDPAIASGLPGIASVESLEQPPEPKLSFARLQRKPKPVLVPILPVTWVNPLPEATVTSCFGERWGRLHAGVDLAAPNGTQIRAAGAGIVVTAGVAQGYGNAVLIDHGNGYLTHYGHMSAILVLVGQKVTAGQQIGLEGSTGNSTGPHLHFEVHQGTYQNPIEPTGWLRAHGVEIPGCTPHTVPAEPKD